MTLSGYLLAAASLLLPTLAPAAQGISISNSTFESGLSDWTIAEKVPMTTLSRDQARGSASLLINDDDAREGSSALSQKFRLAGPGKYTLALQALPISGSGLGVYIRLYDSAGKPVLRVEAKVNGINRISFPKWELVRWDIPARTGLPPISFYWHNGSSRPGMRDQIEGALGRGLDWGDKGEKKWADWAGCLIVGTEGKIYASGHNATFVMLPEDKFRSVQKDRPERLDRSHGHSEDWLAACRGGKAPWANFDYSGPLTEICLLGNLAKRMNNRIDWDAVNLKVTNLPEANQYVRTRYRESWAL